LEVVSKQFGFQNEASIDVALYFMKKNRINVMMVVMFDDDIEYFIAKANEIGLLGSGKMMVFSDGVSTGALSALPTDLQNALSGAGRVLPVGCVNGETGVLFDHFRSFASKSQSWLDLRLNLRMPYEAWKLTPEFMEDYYDVDVSCYVYDAVMAQGIAACDSYAQYGANYTRAQYLEKLQAVEFDSGASGRVEFDSATGNRRKDTGYYVLQNLLFDVSDENFSAPIKGTWNPSGGWETSGFVFSDGTGSPPASVEPVDYSVCGPGFFYDLVEETCGACSPGTWSAGGTDQCIVCGAGTFSVVSAAVTCTRCAAGSSLSDNSGVLTLHDSAEDCTSCEVCCVYHFS